MVRGGCSGWRGMTWEEGSSKARARPRPQPPTVPAPSRALPWTRPGRLALTNLCAAVGVGEAAAEGAGWPGAGES